MVPPSSSGAGQPAAGVSSTADAWSAGGLQPGTVLGNRYEIIQALGEGGMGAVYKARDRELDRLVALKVIRPDLARNPAIIQRFKQELILARQVTHRNVIRIFDLGEAGGIKFITMEFIEGKDLHSLLRDNKKFSPEEAAEIIRQVCLALDCAHSEGVIHRDLKPQNIMRDAQGRIVVMDFGLARSLQSDGMTQTGALIGTMEYMSPEQGLGQELDQRSDLFTLGLIFYELLTGQVPFKAESALASLLKRTQERAVPVSSLDNKVPRAINDMVAKCLERDPKQRYLSAKELLSDLEAWQGKSAAKSIRLPDVQPWGQGLPWRWIGVAVVVVVLAVTGFLLRGRLFGPAQKGPSGPVVSLAILPFQNASNDPSLDWLGGSIAEMLTTDVGQSAELRVVPPDRVQQILHDLRVAPGSGFDAETLRRIATFSNADQVVYGQYVKLGDQIRIDATLQDLKQQRTTSLKAQAPAVKDVLTVIDKLATSVRSNLSLSSSAMRKLQAAAFTPSTKSVDALRDYNLGLSLNRQGNYLDAQQKLNASTTEDPGFAMAYSELAQTYAKLGYDNQAAQAARKALQLSSSLPSPEKYRIAASYARAVNDNQKAIEAYENLAQIFPDDSDVQYSLGELYQLTGNLDKARQHYDLLLKQDPKYLDGLLGLGRLEIAGGNANAGLDKFNQALSLAIQLGNDEAKSTVLDAIGLAYNQLNKYNDALRNLQESLALKRQLGDKRGIAFSLNAIGRVDERLGKLDDALKTYNQALQLRQEIGDKKGIGGTLINIGNVHYRRGDYKDALNVWKESLQIQHDIGDATYEAVCLNNIGSVYFDSGQYEDALTYFQQALQLREKLKNPSDTSETVHNLAEASVRIGQYDQALTYYLRALELSRTASDKLGVAIESQGMATVYSYQGRYGAALSAIQDALKTVQDLKEGGFWLTSIQSSYGNVLSLLGRDTEAQQNLQEALKRARELQSEPLVAELLSRQGDNAFYRGDYGAAQRSFAEALQVASRTTDRYLILTTKLNLAKAAIQQHQDGSALAALKAVAQEAESHRLKYLSAQCSLYTGEALLNGKDYKRAQAELQTALLASQDLGLKPLQARSDYLLAQSLTLGGNSAEAGQHESEARAIIEQMEKESGSQQIARRSDFAPIFKLAH